MKQNNFHLCALIATLFIIIYSLVLVSVFKRRIVKIEDIYRLNLETGETINTEMLESLWDNYFYQSRSRYLYPDNNLTWDLRNTFVLFVAENQCLECIEFAILELQNRHSRLGCDVAVLFDCKDQRKMEIIKSLGSSLKYIPYKFMNTELDFSHPTYCTINENYKLSNILLPDKNKIKLVSEYFNRLSSI